MVAVQKAKERVMGEKIVYCGKCGNILRARDFARGLAHTVDHAHYCTRCRPLATPTMPVSDSDDHYVRSPIARKFRTA
jgi:hypothetical protein